MAPSALFALVSAVLVVAWVCWALHRALPGRDAAVALFGVLWIGLPSTVAATGFLSDFTTVPPRMFFVLFAVAAASFVFAFSKWGAAVRDGFPMAGLIGFQAFRFLPETLLLLALWEDLAPVQMTLEGRNWDIVSAVLAIAIYVIWRNTPGGVPRWAAVAWSIVALGLLLNIVGIAVLSMPTPFRQFHNQPANTFVATFPYILLPTVHVTAALAGHLIVLRKLRT